VHSFTDNANRLWVVTINVAQVRRVHGMIGVDIFQLINGKMEKLYELMGNPMQLADILYCLCKDQADAAKLTDEDFGRSLGGDSLEKGFFALTEELIDFFPSSQAREGMKKTLEAARKVTDLAAKMGEKQLQELDLEQEAKNQLARLLAASSGTAPAS
jgi:hypothetical protein